MSRLTVPIFDPPSLPVRGMRSALHPSLLAPGEYLGLQNMRWDRGQLEVRPGCASYLNAPTAGAVPLQIWSGVLNGTPQVVGAFVVGGKIRLYSKSGSSWSEITESAGWCGDSAFPTGSAPTVRMAQFRTPKVVAFGGTLYPAADVLMIQNGEDHPRVWDPAQNTAAGPGLTVHRPITVPAQAGQFRQVATFKTFLQCAGAGNKTYANIAGPPAINQGGAAAWKLSDSTAVYTGTNAVPQWDATATSPVGAVATVRFANGKTFLGEQLVIAMEGANAPTLLQLASIEISATNDIYGNATNWKTVYDPTSASPWLKEYLQLLLDSGNNRYLFAFKLSHLAASERTVYHVRFVCKVQPAGALTAKILMIAGSGSIEGGSFWGIAYSNQFSRAESAGYVAFSGGGDLLKNIGGPDQGSASTLSLIVSSQVLYDYNLYIKNSETASAAGYTPIIGDLGGEPTGADLYLQRPGSSEFYFAFNVPLWAQGTVGLNKAWNRTQSSPIIVVNTSEAVSFDRNLIDTQRPLPSAFNIAVPPAQDVLWANNRLFVLGVKELLTGTYAYGDLYYSAERLGFRMQPLLTSEDLGSRIVFAGEKGRRLIATAAGAQGAAYVYAFTGDNFYSLGGAGAFLGSGFTATALSRAIRVAPHGTNSPESLVEYRGAIFWVDQDLIVRRYQGGELRELSRLLVDDRLRALPSASRRAALSGLFFRDRYYLGYTPGAGTLNTRILIWNDVLHAWESDDALPANVGAERICRFYDASAAGSGQRMLMLSAADGKTYEYETGTLDPGSANVAWAVTTREITGSSLGLRPGQPFVIDSVNVLTDALNDLWYVDRSYRIPYCEYRSRLDTNAGWVSDEGKAHQALITETDGKGERGCSAYVNFGSGSPGGTRIMRISLNVEPLANEEAISA